MFIKANMFVSRVSFLGFSTYHRNEKKSPEQKGRPGPLGPTPKSALDVIAWHGIIKFPPNSPLCIFFFWGGGVGGFGFF